MTAEQVMWGLAGLGAAMVVGARIGVAWARTQQHTDAAVVGRTPSLQLFERVRGRKP